MYKIIGGDGKEYGPISGDQLKQWLVEGRVNAQTQTRLDGTTEWRPLSAFPEFAVASASPAAPPSYPAFAGVASVPDARMLASSAIKGPAIALIVTASLNLLYGLFGLVQRSAAIEMYSNMPQFKDPQMQHFLHVVAGPIGLVASAFHLLISLVILFGGIRMLGLKNYGLAMTASILALIPCITPCCGIITLPFGIWALVMLSKAHVKSAFD